MFPIRNFSLKTDTEPLEWSTTTLRNVHFNLENLNLPVQNLDFEIFRADDKIFYLEKTTATNIPIMLFNPDERKYYYNESLASFGLTEPQADLLYVKLEALQQTVTGSLYIDGTLGATTLMADSNTTTPAITFDGHTNTGVACQTVAPGEAKVEHYVDGTREWYYDKSDFVVEGQTFHADTQRFVSADAGMKYENATTGSLYFNSETPLLFRETEVEITKPLIVPASTEPNTSSADYSIQFENANTTAIQTKFGIKAICTTPGSPNLAFILNNGSTTDNVVMAFDRSNMDVRQTLRCDTVRMRSTDAGLKYAGIINVGGVNYPTPGLHYTIGGVGSFFCAIFNQLYFQTLAPLRVSIGDTTVANQVGTPISGTDITIIRRLTPSAPITLTGPGNGSVTLPLGVTLPNTNYDVQTILNQTSGNGHITVTVGTKTTSQVTLNYSNVSNSLSVYGQMSNQTAQTVVVPNGVGTYVAMAITGTFDTVQSAGTSAPTTASFGVKNTSGETRLFTIIATADIRASGQIAVGLKLAKNGVPDDRTECRAPTGNTHSFAKVMTQWMLELADGDEVSMFVANITDTGDLTIDRAKIVAFTVAENEPVTFTVGGMVYGY